MRLSWKIAIFHCGAQRTAAKRAAQTALGGLVLCALFAVQPLRAQFSQIDGLQVAGIVIVDESGAPVTLKTPSLALEVGKPFDFTDERESLRALYKTGNYADIRVFATNQPDGLHIQFVVRKNFFNNVVRINGLREPPTEGAALAALRLPLGAPFRENATEEAVGRLKDTLHSEGLFLANVNYSVVEHPETRQMDIFVTVDPGPRARVGNITFKNQTTFPDADLLRRSKLSPKNDATSGRLNRSSQRMKKFLVDQGYLGAAIIITPGKYDAAANRVPLLVDVTAGPRVRVEVGGAKLSKNTLRKLLPIYAEGAVDEDLLQEGRRNIRDYFQRQGYFRVEVQVSSHEDAQGGERVIAYEISRGDRFRLAGVAISGNKYFETSLLMNRLQIQPASFANSGRFSQALVRADADSMRGLYQSNGFREAEVTSNVDEDYQGRKGNLFVSFQIVEGPQTRVASLEIKGNEAISTDAILSVVGSSAGQPFSDAGVASDRNNILAMYYNEGFPEARFQNETSPGSEPNTIHLIYRLTEGQQIIVAQVLLTGFVNTRPSIISRQVQVKPGGPLREGDVVETQRRLYNLGVFNRVQIAPQNPDGSDPNKTVVVDMTEGGRYTIGYGFGFEVQRLAGSGTNTSAPAPGGTTGTSNPAGTTIGASPRGIFEIARFNMFGRAQTLSFKVRASTLQYRAVLSYTADNFLANKKLSAQLTGYADKTQDITTFNSTRYEAAAQLVETLSPSSSILYRYFFRRVTATNLQITSDEIPLFSQPTLVAGFGITYARDRRDNPADATQGTFNTIDVSQAIRAVGSSASFFRGYFQNSSFHPLGRAFVFARSVRFGIEIPTGNTVEPNSAACEPDPATGIVSCNTIPLPERFFAGGGTSLRGFSLNQAGPRDPTTGFPVGGLALLTFNQELRFPMKLPFVGNKLGGQILYDLGNVYSDINHVSFAWKPPSPTNLSYMSQTVGFGVRYPTPIGPIRVDFAYQLNSPLYQVINTSVTPNVTELFRIPHFQFFFNIGPVF